MSNCFAPSVAALAGRVANNKEAAALPSSSHLHSLTNLQEIQADSADKQIWQTSVFRSRNKGQ